MRYLIPLVAFIFSLDAFAKIKVMTTTSNLYGIVREVGGGRILAESICPPNHDPHHIAAKPTYMVKLAAADLLVSVGLELEAAWLDPLVRGARNPKIRKGAKGYLDIGVDMDVIGKPTQEISRKHGDIHAYGNPHYLLDPIRAKKTAEVIARRLAELDPKGQKNYQNNLKTFNDAIDSKIKSWQAQLDSLKPKEIVTYHKTLDYFLKRFGLEAPIVLEPKPGIAPSAKHLIDVVNTVNKRNIKVIAVESYFDERVADKVKSKTKNVSIHKIPVAFDQGSMKRFADLYQAIVDAMTGKVGKS